LAGKNEPLDLRKLPDAYEVSFKRPAAPAKTSIVEGRLVIANATMRPIAETLRVQDGDDTREYHFQELGYEVLRADQVHASDFVPDTDTSNPNRSTHMPDDAHLALQALQVLGNQPENIRAAVDIERHPGTGINITGVLPTREDARSLVQSLQALEGGSTLRIALHSSDEPLTPHRISMVDVNSPVSIESDRIPLDSMLRDSLGTRLGLSGADLDEHVKEAAREIVAKSARVHRAAWDASQIGSRDFRSGELTAMSPQDKQLWLALLARPLDICDQELSAIGVLLVGEKTATPASPEPLNPLSTVGELARTADLVQENADRLNRLVSAGFALSPKGSSAPVSQAELLSLLSEVQHEERRLALTVQRLQQAASQHRNE
jgi:hypothetical protein